MALTPLTLNGKHVRLEPLAQQHLADLLQAGQDEEIWRYMLIPMPFTTADMQQWLDDALARQAIGDTLPFAVVDARSGRAIGSTRYLDISEKDRHLEIGWTWLAREYWRTPVNTECKYLLLRHAFDDLHMIRVQLKTDARNERSQRAIERLGAVREGVLRKAVITSSGYQRWSVYYSILDDEWPAVRSRLEMLLNNSDA